MDCLKGIINIRRHLDGYVTRQNIKALVIGISGGVDSAVCAALALPVCVERNIPLVGMSLHTESNTEEEVNNSIEIGNAFCTEFNVKWIDDAMKDMLKLIFKHCWHDQDNIESRIRIGNIKARARMIYLYDEAGKREGVVLSTDNFTEYLLGFWTLHGDVGDFAMLQDLWKTEVYHIAEALKKEALENKKKDGFNAMQTAIKAVPTDGLGITATDFDQLGAETYEEVDGILKAYFKLKGNIGVNPDAFKKLVKHPVIKRHIGTEFKRNNPRIISRYDIVT